jgi:hypothetical protein
MMRRMWFPMVLIGGLSMLATGLLAQDASPCADAKFDFWIGDWEVFSGDQLAGHNTIEPILDGCVLQESWVGASGSAGSSLNFFNPQTDRWQQFWVWRQGTTLELEGEYSDGKMTLEGDSLDAEGNTVHNRITWHVNPDGTVRQHWQTSTGDGGEWQTAFDGLYRRRE